MNAAALQAPNPHWTVEQGRGPNPHWLLRFHPTPDGVKNPDGTTTFTVSFPALQMTDWVSEPETAAKAIARELNAHASLVTLAQRTRDVMRGFSAEAGDEAAMFADDIDAVLDRIGKDGA